MKLLCFALLLVFCACSLNQNRRDVASGESCVLVKHPKEGVYQVQIDGRPHSEFWYDYDYGLRLKDQLCQY